MTTVPKSGLQSQITNPLSSITYCRRVTRRARSSFPLAFRLLAPPKRDAMAALYAFCRVSDDLADGPQASREALRQWRARLRDALHGDYTHRLHAALHDTVRRYEIPPQYLEAILDGVEADLGPVTFATFDELHPYCYRVASAVGVVCLYIWGVRAPENLGPAIDRAADAGIAFQLTNILRDLGEDLARGRVYLPRDELARFGSPPDSWQTDRAAFRGLMRFQVERARHYYATSEPLAELLTPDGRAVFRLMAGVYRRLLDEIERRDYDVFTRRVRVGTLTRLRLFAAAWLTR